MSIDGMRGIGIASSVRNPLGIIALFIVSVYGIASMVMTVPGTLTHEERLPLVYFLVIFPVLVLGVFSWLVSAHSGKLFSPADFRDEDNYIKMQFSAVASLATAAAKRPSLSGPLNVTELVETVRNVRLPHNSPDGDWANRVLWVDDQPKNNLFERQAFEAVGIKFLLANSTSEALELLEKTKFGAIISDMARIEGAKEGYVLLDEIRARRDETPLFFYSSSNDYKHKLETEEHGGQGSTNNAQDLFQMVMKAVISGRGK